MYTVVFPIIFYTYELRNPIILRACLIIDGNAPYIHITAVPQTVTKIAIGSYLVMLIP